MSVDGRVGIHGLKGLNVGLGPVEMYRQVFWIVR